MRLVALSVCLAMVSAASALAAPPAPAKKQTPAEAAQAAKMARVDTVAKEAFKVADRNHNDILSKTELPAAEEALYEGIYSLGMQNVLGQLQNGQINKDSMALSNKAVAATPNLSKKNRISLSEFQQLAHGMAAEADIEFAQARFQGEQIQKSMANRRGRGRQVHTGSPVFVSPF